MLKIPKAVFEKVKLYGEKAAPIEACGYFAGNGDEVKEFIPMTNADASAEHFSFDPKEQFAAVKNARAKGLELIAVFHTHPASPARMSDEDIKLANDPAVRYVILSLVDGKTGCFTVTEGKKIISEHAEVV